MAEISVSNQSVVIVDDEDRTIVLTLEKFKKLMDLYIKDFQKLPEGMMPVGDNFIDFTEEEIDFQEQEEQNAALYDIIEEDEPYNVTAGMREDFDERDSE